LSQILVVEFTVVQLLGEVGHMQSFDVVALATRNAFRALRAFCFFLIIGLYLPDLSEFLQLLVLLVND
jgi:hypothetical protein